MDHQEQIILYYSALLHDIGKLYYRSGTSIDECISKIGALVESGPMPSAEERVMREAINKICQQFTQQALEKNSLQEEDFLGCVIEFADQIASGRGYDDPLHMYANVGNIDVNLKSIFNNINGYSNNLEIEHDSYLEIVQSFENEFNKLPLSMQGVNALEALLEDTTSSIPASLHADGLDDISLYDHAKATACFASCINKYFLENKDADYSSCFTGANKRALFDEPVFLLFTCDLNGIQKFIYNISGAGALRQLRARSLYLELLLEVIVDEILAITQMARPNIQYIGGGHCYLLLPNTSSCRESLLHVMQQIQDWFIEQFKTDLYISTAWIECSANDLLNNENGRGYANTYRALSQELSCAKMNRYSADVLLQLNYSTHEKLDSSRECTECHRSDLRINPEGKCPICAAFGNVSRSISKKCIYRVVQVQNENDSNDSMLPLPLGYWLDLCEEDTPNNSGHLIRSYVKNHRDVSGEKIRLWIADYCAEVQNNDISLYARESSTLDRGRGVERLGVLRADVDNLGATFLEGIPNEKQSFSRSSALSRALNKFFKIHLSELLEKSAYRVQIIYSGGDDLFIIGNWNDVIHAGIDIREELAAYVGSNAITMSAGIGMFSKSYPIARMASETGELEDTAKMFKQQAEEASVKNAITLWTKEHTYSWDYFIDSVFSKKENMSLLFENSAKGSSFIYNFLDVLRNYNDVVSAPRLAYLLARSSEEMPPSIKEQWTEIYDLVKDEVSRCGFIAALEWYVYCTRERS